jgi:multidrug efflux system outer membrane protein
MKKNRRRACCAHATPQARLRRLAQRGGTSAPLFSGGPHVPELKGESIFAFPNASRNKMVRLLSCILLSVLSGCMVGPNYKEPEITVADEWVETEAGEEIVERWWEEFNDPLLNQYIQEGALHNRDILMAEANILQAMALKQVAAANLFPQIGLDFNATKTYFSKNGPVFAIGPATGSLPGSVSSLTGLPFAVQIPQVQNLYNFLFDVSWELDLFGKTRRGIEAAAAQIESAIEKKKGALLTVVAEIARHYMQLRSYQKLVELTQQNIDLLEKTAVISLERLNHGYVSKLDYESVEAELASAKTKLPSLISEVYKNVYTISVLVGKSPESLLSELWEIQPLPEIPDKVAIGLRSDILRRRPDVRYAERQLAAATANIGVAVASFFPTFTLFTDGGLQSLNWGHLFNLKSKTWDYGGDVNLPLYQGGQLTGNLQAMQAATTAAMQSYEETILKALQEAEQFLATYQNDLKTLTSLKDVVSRNQILVSLTKERYEKGLINQIHFFTMQRQLLATQQTLVSQQGIALSDLISLYKALGGGLEKPFENLTGTVALEDQLP